MKFALCTIAVGPYRILDGYLISFVVGWLVAGIVVDILHRLSNIEDDYDPHKVYFTLILGGFERTVITTIAIFSLEAAGTFVLAWMALKLASGWNRPRDPISDLERDRLTRGALASLMGSLASAAMGFAGAVIICQKF